MNTYAKIFLALLSGVAVGIETAYPHAAWAVPVVTAITAALGTMHLVPGAPVAARESGTSTEVNTRAPGGAANVPGS